MIGELGVTTSGAQNLEWNNKLCDYKLWQKTSKGNKTWCTGTWKKNLHTITNGKEKASDINIEVQARSRCIIDKRESNAISIAPNVKGVSFSTSGRILSTISMR